MLALLNCTLYNMKRPTVFFSVVLLAQLTGGGGTGEVVGPKYDDKTIEFRALF
jgi:hypothetical protein